MNMLKEYLKSIWPGRNDPVKHAEKMSRDLVLLALKSANRVYNDSEFLGYFNLDNNSKREKGRLLNELGLTSICLVLSVIEDFSYRNDEEKYFWQDVKEKVPEIFKKWLKSMGVDKKHVEIWSGLIDGRYKEYNKCELIYRRAKNKYDRSFADDNNEVLKDFYVRYQALSFGSIYHLRKGEPGKKDPLYKYLRTWLSVLNNQIEEKVRDL